MDYIHNNANKFKIEFVGKQNYVKDKTSVFGVRFIGEKRFFNDPNFVCPFSK